ncbi:hypothetical protein DTL42_25120 [Bremerella cremea]|uniref:Uncharacterized protein n=1 Tax=Bremerella cremea TaxID=1031537 RepID=A0A368KJA7_9BACT|nr:hypothetical protein [Bremerella cremea]RCS40653.1 hypothetical protein DTL42_25120 [Bremerella cremea]
MIQSHHLPTCDDVFDVLTRGPFPTGQHDTDFPVQRHLTVCHSCRELAEALRPVTAVLAEGQQEVSTEETSLPVFLAEAQAPCNCCVTDQAEQKSTDPIRVLRGPLIAFALCVMVMLAFTSNWLGGQHKPNPTPVSPSGTLVADVPAPNSGLLEAGFSLANCSLLAVDNVKKPAASVAESTPVQTDEHLSQKFSAEQCCSQCHHAGQASQPAASNTVTLKGTQIIALASRCHLCHGQ